MVCDDPLRHRQLALSPETRRLLLHLADWNDIPETTGPGDIPNRNRALVCATDSAGAEAIRDEPTRRAAVRLRYGVLRLDGAGVDGLAGGTDGVGAVVPAVPVVREEEEDAPDLGIPTRVIDEPRKVDCAWSSTKIDNKFREARVKRPSGHA